MKEFVQRLTSRKFLLALGAAITALAAHQYAAASAIVIGYLTTEGILDHKNLSRATAAEAKAAVAATRVDTIVKQVLAQLQSEQVPKKTRSRSTRNGSTK